MKGNRDKEAFRRTTRWRNFRKQLIEERGQICQCCGKKTKLLQLHHADNSVENYQNLEPTKFYLLCALCHKCVSALEQIKPENWYKIRSENWVNLYKEFLIEPSNERQELENIEVEAP